MTPDEVTLKDVYELLGGVRAEQKCDIKEVQKTMEDYKALIATANVAWEKRFSTIEGDVKVLNTRIYYLAAGLSALAAFFGALIGIHGGF